ncbi:MAG: hypothetical protein COB29_14160 [Sulfitobacter sp.]|nr:MAG: hypothetical protein COB29_14160 [Sulfitobacter sp.]
MKPLLKRTLHWIGSALAIAGVVFVTLRLKEYGAQLDFSRFTGLAWLAITILALIYGVANTALAFAWRNLLSHFSVDTTRQWAVKIYGLTQLAKYVPGNIMHLAGRQALGQADGIAGWSLAKASIWEIGLISVTGAFFSILVIPQYLPAVSTPLAALGFVSLILIMALGLKKYMNINLVQAFGGYVVFLVVAGAVFVGSLMLTMNDSSIIFSNIVLLGGAFVVAWLAGLVTPGAPAGIGVREFVLIILLQGLIPEQDLLLAVLLSRIITVGGDILFFLLAAIMSWALSD